MSVLAQIAPGLPHVFEPLVSRYRFTVHVESEGKLILRSDRCIVEITVERYGGGVSVVELRAPDPRAKPYRYLYVMIMRNPECRGGHAPSGDESLPDEQRLLKGLRRLNDNLVRYCPDLLVGDFSAIEQQGYQALATYIKTRMPVVLSMPPEDPIKVKFWQGDFSWVDDLRERERRGEQRSTPP